MHISLWIPGQFFPKRWCLCVWNGKVQLFSFLNVLFLKKSKYYLFRWWTEVIFFSTYYFWRKESITICMFPGRNLKGEREAMEPGKDFIIACTQCYRFDHVSIIIIIVQWLKSLIVSTYGQFLKLLLWCFLPQNPRWNNLHMG